ncbi:MAG: hypothetical protein AABX07_06200 [Nanoarchaeota archaeon]
MKELLENADEFIASAEDNLIKERYNASVSDFFKAIANLCDYLIYREIKLLPKNHKERFDLLHTHFKEISENLSDLFQLYRESYNLRLKKEDALKLKHYAYELKKFVSSKE